MNENILERIGLLLQESFDSRINISVEEDREDLVIYEFSIRGKVYTFTASSYYDEEAGMIWVLEFGLSAGSGYDRYGYNEVYGVTGTGDQMKVFAAVAMCFDKFVKSHKPECFYFTADVKSRMRLYDRFAKMIEQKYPYKRTKDENLIDTIGVGRRGIYVFIRR